MGHKKKAQQKSLEKIKAINLGKIIQDEISIPLIRFLIRDPNYRHLIKHFNLTERYKEPYELLSRSITYTLNGHCKGYEIPPYQGLLDKNGIKRLVYLRKIKGKKGSQNLTDEERQKIASKAGKVSGNKAFNDKTGIHALTERQLDNARALAIKARRQTPWSDKERIENYELAQNPEYRKGSQIKLAEIAKTLNKNNHQNKPVRNSNAVNFELRRYKSRLEELNQNQKNDLD